VLGGVAVGDQLEQGGLALGGGHRQRGADPGNGRAVGPQPPVLGAGGQRTLLPAGVLRVRAAQAGSPVPAGAAST
jgi:hypothetical protein